jgi:hypothetical protein
LCPIGVSISSARIYESGIYFLQRLEIAVYKQQKTKENAVCKQQIITKSAVCIVHIAML